MKDNSGKIMLALLAGASAGVIAGLLMAPDSGTATRDSLKKFQETSELKVTGTLNAMTLEKMGIALTDSQKAAATSSISTPKD